MTPSDVASGYDAVVGGAAAFELDRDVVLVRGPDAVPYLQGQLSQDVAALVIGESAWSLLLQPQGKVDAWIRVTRTGDDAMLLDVDGGWGEAVVARLSRFKLRTKADIGSVPWRCVAVRGSAVPDLTGRETDVVAGADWPLIGGTDLLGPDPVPPDGVALAPLEVYEVRRIEAGLPRMGHELTDRTIPAEAGVVERSVSFTKGCYTGQELVARIDSRGGHVPRIIRGIVLEPGPLPEVGAVVEAGGREVGTLTSVAAHPGGYGVALASIRRDVEPPTEGACAGLVATIRTLPLVS